MIKMNRACNFMNYPHSHFRFSRESASSNSKRDKCLNCSLIETSLSPVLSFKQILILYNTVGLKASKFWQSPESMVDNSISIAQVNGFFGF